MDDFQKIIKKTFAEEADRTLEELKEDDSVRLSKEDKDAMRASIQKMIEDSEKK